MIKETKKKVSDDKYMGTVKIGPKGQIIIPKEVRDMFNFNAGDNLLLLADKEKGIAIQSFDSCDEIFKQFF